MALSSGARLGPYEILSLVGSGGMGEVYKARDVRLDRTVAIKILPSTEPELKVRFEREAKAIAALTHPHICTLYDVGHQDGTDYLVMEYLDGETLAARIKRRPLRLNEALEIARDIADALDTAHSAGIVHRDLKPANVMLTNGGTKLLDFGLAKLRPQVIPAESFSRVETKSTISSRGSILGTLQYMAPEQVRGQVVDHRSDIFSFGAMLYEMLTSERAFQGETPADTMTAILIGDPFGQAGADSGLPPVLVRIVARCLEKTPAARFQSAGDLAFALEALSAQSGTSWTPADVPSSTTRDRQSWTLATLSGALAVVAVAAATVAYYFLHTAPDQRTVRFEILPPEGWTVEPSSPNHLAVSPDGRQIAFRATAKDGRGLLWVRSLAAATAEPLTGTDGAMFPFWSPDSRSIGFFTSNGILKRIDVAGGPPVTVCNAGGPREATWGRNGVIVFSGATGIPLQKVSASGGTPTAATVLGDGEVTHGGPHFLPDGQHFLYRVVPAAESLRATRPVYVASLDPAERPRRVNDDWPQVLPADGHVLFVRDGTLMAQSFDASRPALTADAFPIVQEVAAGAFSVSQTGALVYQTPAPRGGAQTIWFDRTGARLATLGDRADYDDVELSPDGKLAAVSLVDSAHGSRKRNLWLLDVGRGTRTRLTGGEAGFAPIWSPDGSRIVFGCPRRFTLDMCQTASNGVGAEEVLLSSDQAKLPVSWSPDGQFILFRHEPDNRLWVLPLSGNRKPFPYMTAFNQVAGQFSPDGQWSAFVSNETGQEEVYVASFPTPTAKRLVSNAGGTLPRWRRDGRELFYLAPSVGKLMAASLVRRGTSLEVSEIRALFDLRASRQGRYPYDVSADGQRFLVNTPDDSAPKPVPINVVLNWTGALKR